MIAEWRVWTDARTERAARKVATRLLERLSRQTTGLSFEPYPKTGGWTFRFRTPLVGTTWNDYVVDVIALGQRVGYGWSLSGTIYEDPSGWSNKAQVGGVTSVTWWMWTDAELERSDAEAEVESDEVEQ